MDNEKLLRILKSRSVHISGEEISHHLGITRAAIWKHIHELKDLGYDIAAVPHLGYRLLSCPDRLFPWEVKYQLKNQFIGKSIYYHDTLSSTMDIAADLAFNNAAEGTIVIAEGQTKGKGRMGRTWISHKYKGIYFSLIIKPKIPPHQSPILTLISALVICEALKKELGLQAQIKWPNDILLNNKKIAGILTELNAETDVVHAIVIGVGINVNNDNRNLPHTASSLKEAVGNTINRLNLLKTILRCFEAEYLAFQKQGVDRILDRWRHFSLTLGKRVKLSLNINKPQLVGEAVDIDADGALLIRKDSGLMERVVAGDIIHCKQ